MTVATYKWTIDRYHQAVEAGVFDDVPVELLSGELIEMSPEGTPHAYYSNRSGKYLQRLLSEKADVREGHPVTLPDQSEPQPDLAIVQPLDEAYLEHHPYAENIFWLIEYSNTSLDKDLKVKSKVYAEANISEYWVINLRTRELIVFRDPVNGEYRSQVTLTSGMICPLSFADVQIDVSRLIR